MPVTHHRRILQAGSLACCLWTVLPVLAQAPQTDSADGFDSLSAQECALISDGAQRLACYDAINDPSAVREQASEKTLNAIGDSIDALEYEEQANSEQGSEVSSASVSQDVAAERAIFSFSGTFVSHRPMYILPVSYMSNINRVPSSPRLGPTRYDYGIENLESKYQISFKVPLLTGWLDDRTTLWFGYSQKSFWQVYNQKESAPFRETNYEPEIFLRYAANLDVGPGTFNNLSLGFNHVSNGQSEPRSRSWNRLVASASYSYDRWLFMVQPWYRLQDSEDDNPDIERFLGYANYMAIYKWTDDRTLSLHMMNNLRSEGNKTSIQLSYSFPLGDTIKGYLQYYNGYGESLIDYNQRIQRIGIGIMLNDWL